jgi:hypothetical protein
MFDWTKVTSSQIDAMAYHNDLLFVRFTKGTVYRYLNVSRETFAAIISADSVGKAFNVLIKAKPNDYPYTQLLDDPGNVHLAPGLPQNNHQVG